MAETWYDDPTAGLTDPECFPLHRYAALMGHDEFAFFGITDLAADLDACDTIWGCDQRLRLSRALLQAQFMIEEELGFPICGEYICDEEQRSNQNLYRRQQERFTLDRGYIIAIGTETEASVDADVTVVDGATDQSPVTLSIAAGVYSTALPLDELRFYEDGVRAHQLFPSQIFRADSGALTITIPRSRMVKSDNECDATILITDDTKFIDAVDVFRNYTDETAGVTIINEPPVCNGTAACAAQITTGCAYIMDARLGLIMVQPAAWDEDDEQWDRNKLCWCPDKIQLTYKAGYSRSCDGKWVQADLSILSLALTLMATPPCGCTHVRDYFTQMHKPAPVFSSLELVPPWGGAEGAWRAWQFVQRFALGRGGLDFSGLTATMRW